MFDHFGLLAPVYEKFIKPKPPEKLTELLELPISGPLLDVGGGTGRVSKFFTKKAGPVYIADLSHEMLVQSLGKESLRPVCSHAEKLPFPNEFFERIIIIDALHHVCDQAQTAAELWRVLKPGGKL
ncbi:MAG: class I SAM-dependent methyltransferase, partial [Anaerolineales bacterium]|nr:class I SAM-dependent methyltransferase [Anaerolineales bacterium]